MAKTNEVAKATTNEVSNGDFNSRLLAAAAAEQAVRAESGSNLTWISGPLALDSDLCNPDSDTYIKGAKPKGFVIANKQLNLGLSFDAIILGMFKVYAEQTVPMNGEMAKTVSYWLPEDAQQIPLEGQFKRPLSNGNELNPVHWVFLYIPSHPELEGVILSFRSTGNKIYTELEKAVKAQSKICPELKVTISSQGIKNEKYNKTYYYPKFTIDEQRNFNLTEDGVKAVKGGLDSEELKVVLDRYCDLSEAFVQNKTVVAKKANIAGYLPGNTSDEDTDYIEDSGENVKF